jgi:hypothetical protein
MYTSLALFGRSYQLSDCRGKTIERAMPISNSPSLGYSFTALLPHSGQFWG